jgi:beta-galactosidase
MKGKDSMTKHEKTSTPFRVGVDYYPEHWPVERWETDARLMKKAGFNVVRLAEFAWARMEPSEGQYEFDWLDRAIAILGRYGIDVVLGTPTASMPPWVARKYPEAVSSGKDGQKSVYGIRQNACFSSGSFNLLSERITRAMAEHYAGNPHVIGWQTDNEFTGGLCHCDLCGRAFQDWLRAKYKTLEELNRAWGTHFWNHIYGDWAEIPISVRSDFDNPSLYLDWKRFCSDSAVRFQHEQVKILRQCCPEQFITHNLMGLASSVNYFDLGRDLDFVSWDNYPVRGEPNLPTNNDCALAADVMRGVRRQNFWIMETSAGPLGWGVMQRNLRPGELRKVALHQVAHGADGIVWFRWRTCTAGREQYWHGLLGHDGKAGRRYDEAAATAKELHRLWPLLAGTTVKTGVAMIYDYDSIWAFETQPAYEANKRYADALLRFHVPLQKLGVNADVIGADGDFSAYKVIIAPHLYVLPEAVAKRLEAFVKAGGVLVTDVRTGVKDETGLIPMETPPCALAKVLGIAIPEYESIAKDYPMVGEGALEGTFTATGFADWIVPAKATVLARHGAWHSREYAAATVNAFGKGAAYHVGAVVKEESFYRLLLQEVCRRAGVTTGIEPPEGVEAVVREGGDRRLLFLVNHTEQPVSVNVPAGRTCLFGGGETGRELQLPPFGVEVVRL